MQSLFETAPAASAIPITFATKTTWDAIAGELPGAGPAVRARQRLCRQARQVPDAALRRWQIAQVLFGLEDETAKSRDLFRPGALPGLLPPGVYRFANAPHDARLATLAFALGQLSLRPLPQDEPPDVRLVPPDGVDVADIARMAEAATLARDLINTPSNDMGPEELAQAAQALATRFGASFNCIVGDDLRDAEFSADPRGRHGLDRARRG